MDEIKNVLLLGKDILIKLAAVMPPNFWFLVLGGAILLSAVKWDKCRHTRFVVQAAVNLRRLSKINEPWKKYEFLREVNPFVFEEMLLTAFKKRGYTIKRNTRYTGDGGIDGHVKIKNQWYAIQAKRYKKYINLKDVKELSSICRRRRLKGLFIHTGKTGAASREAAKACNFIQIISGKQLLKLLERPF